jgi:hypothetical protein
MQNDIFRVAGIAPQQALGLLFGLPNPSARVQPARALHDEEAADDDRHDQQERARIHPAPSPDVGVLVENQQTDGDAGEATHRLKAEGTEHHSPADSAWNAFRR